ncbi:hypothetical protein [Sinobaca sp. H24]|uniref:hypothetical protein n=1 Tax=Sinobaca sp. H24 TaxID=2923376 RepID=UPI00207A27A3|nr:hypothetical protein [Sinobaca sp. H24]
MKSALFICVSIVVLFLAGPEAAAAAPPTENQDMTGTFILITLAIFAVIIALFVWFLNKYRKNK